MKKNSEMILVFSFLTLLVVNSVVLYLANMLFPNSIVLGTHALDSFWSIFHSMGTLSVLGLLAIPIVHTYELSSKKEFSGKHWMATYFALNFVGIWVISRFSEQFGLGFSSWMYVLGFSAVLNFVQGIAMMALEKWRTS